MNEQAERKDLKPSEGRVPPNDLDAEAAVISAVFMDRSSLDEVADFLHVEHFYSDANARIYEAQLDLHAAGKPIDTVTVKGWLQDRGQLQRVGGVPYLVQIVDAVPAVAHVQDYAQSVVTKWRIRQMILEAQRTSAEGYGTIEDAQSWIDEREQAMFAIASQRQGNQPERVATVIERQFQAVMVAAERGTSMVGVYKTGLQCLDEVLVGALPGDLVIVAARPGKGKSSLLGQWALNVSRPVEDSETGQRATPTAAAVFTLEMPREQYAQRILAGEADVDSKKLITTPERIGKDEWARLTKAASEIKHHALWIDDDSAPNLTAIRAKARRLAVQAEQIGSKLAVVGVDYLQLMGNDTHNPSREQQISANSRGLKRLAKDMGVVVLCLSQMNRSIETRGKSAEPQLSDLRESGAIEQDADIVVFLHQADPKVPVFDIIVAKNRNFGGGRCKAVFQKTRTRFVGHEDGRDYGEDDRGW